MSPRSLLLAAGLACTALLAATPVSAQITFTLNNVSLGVPVGGSVVNAGSLTGTFTTNSNTITSMSTLLTWSLSAPSTAAINGHAFTGFTYNPTDSTAHFNVGSSGLLTGFELDAPVNSVTANATDAVRLYFTTNLAAGSPITLGNTSSLPSSYENEQASGGNRWVQAGGTVFAAVPEPSSWMLGFLSPLVCSRESVPPLAPRPGLISPNLDYDFRATALRGCLFPASPPRSKETG